MPAKNTVTKIYRLETIGYDSLHKQFTTLSEDLVRIKKNILDLQGKKIGLSGEDLNKVNQQIVEQGKALDQVQKKVAAVNAENQTSINNYFQLNKAYQAAKKSAQDLAVQFGADSVQAKEAAAAVGVYKQQLIDINNLVKTGGQPLAPVVPISQVQSITTPRVNDADLQKTGDVISDLERKEAEASNAAFALGQANQEMAAEIKAAAVDVSAITTQYEEFTGSYRQNQIAAIENNNALILNRNSQKELQSAINAQGSATEAQTNKMAALKEEARLLTETNKGLEVTLRNQAKEFLATSGSLDEQQAQLNQLQQAYEQLSATEQASPFGKKMKAEIDVLEPKVKSLEAELGKFSRNVGNYPQIFGGAFKVLERELDVVQGKLVAGNFSGNELANLTAQEKVLTNATKVLGQTFATTAQQQAAFKEQGRQLALVFGTDSVVYKNFAREVATGNAALRASDLQLTKAAGSANKFTGALNSVYGGFRKLANFIPGLGISGLVLALLTPLQGIASEIMDKIFGSSQKAADAIDKLTQAQERNTRIIEAGQSEYVKVVTTVRTLSTEIDLAKKGFLNKNDVLKEYNATLGKSIGYASNLSEAEKLIVEKAPDYIKATVLKAEANLALGEAARKAFEAEQLQTLNTDKIVEVNREQLEKLGINVADVKRIAAAARKQRAIENKLDAEQLQKLAADLLEKAAKLTKDKGINFFDFTKTKDNTFQNALKDIDTARAEAIAIENKRVNEIQKIRQLDFDEEIFHLNEVQRINIDALNKKILLFDAKKKLTAEEKKDRAEFAEQITAIELKTSKDINDIEKKRFDKSLKGLQGQLDSEINQININKQEVLDNIDSTELQKAQAQLDADNAEEAPRKKFYDALLLLNDQFNAESLQKAKDAIDKQAQETKKDRQKITGATIADIKAASDKELQQEDIRFELLRNKILSNDQLTAFQRKKLLDSLGKAHRLTVLRIELNTLLAQEELLKTLYAFGLVSEKVFLDAQEKLVTKSAELQNEIVQQGGDTATKLKRQFSNIKDVIQAGLVDLFKINTDSEEGKKLAGAVGEIVAQSYDLAQQAMNDYFDAERQRIEQSLQLNLERLQIEEDQVKARATSAAEIASIEKQYAAKRKAEERKAHEELRKSKRSEAKIAFAVELANIWASAASYGFPAGLIIGAILTALAGARLAIHLNQINREQFVHGGMVPTKTGGEITGPSHAAGGVPFNYEAQGKELAIINKTSAQDNKVRTITGTNKQILSFINEMGGGVSFASGAKAVHFEGGGYLGTNLQAPVFTPASAANIFNSNSITKEDLEEFTNNTTRIMKDAIKESIKQIEVVQQTATITNAQKKQVRQSKINSL